MIYDILRSSLMAAVANGEITPAQAQFAGMWLDLQEGVKE